MLWENGKKRNRKNQATKLFQTTVDMKRCGCLGGSKTEHDPTGWVQLWKKTQS